MMADETQGLCFFVVWVFFNFFYFCWIYKIFRICKFAGFQGIFVQKANKFHQRFVCKIFIFKVLCKAEFKITPSLHVGKSQHLNIFSLFTPVRLELLGSHQRPRLTSVRISQGCLATRKESSRREDISRHYSWAKKLDFLCQFWVIYLENSAIRDWILKCRMQHLLGKLIDFFWGCN